MKETKIYIPFSKRDDVRHEVSGYASTESVDTQGEVVAKEAIRKALPDYMKFPTIREMHQFSAVGKTEDATVDKKGLFIKAKIVDPIAWMKIKEGVYNGFSLGGKAIMKVGNVIKDLLLREISIVDRPANPETVFTLVKFDKKGRPATEENVEVELEKIVDPGWIDGYFDTMRKVV